MYTLLDIHHKLNAVRKKKRQKNKNKNSSSRPSPPSAQVRASGEDDCGYPSEVKRWWWWC